MNGMSLTFDMGGTSGIERATAFERLRCHAFLGPGRRLLITGIIGLASLAIAPTIGCSKEQGPQKPADTESSAPAAEANAPVVDSREPRAPASVPIATPPAMPAAKGSEKVDWPPHLTAHNGELANGADPAELVLEVSESDPLKYKGFLRPRDFSWLPWEENGNWSLDITGGRLVSRIRATEKHASFKRIGLVFQGEGQARAVCRAMVLTEGQILIPNPFLLSGVPGIYVDNDFYAEDYGGALILVTLRAGESSLALVEQGDRGFFITAACPGTRIRVGGGKAYERRPDGWYVDGRLVAVSSSVRAVPIEPPEVTSVFHMEEGVYPPEPVGHVGVHGRLEQKAVVIVGSAGGVVRAWGDRIWVEGDMLRFVEGEVSGKARVTDWSPIANVSLEKGTD